MMLDIFTNSLPNNLNKNIKNLDSATTSTYLQRKPKNITKNTLHFGKINFKLFLKQRLIKTS